VGGRRRGPAGVDLRGPAGAVLGLWDGHDAGVALIADGRLLFALSEERPDRRKRTSGFPRLALRECLAWAGSRGIELAHVALAGCWGRAPQRLAEALYRDGDPHREPLGRASRAAMAWEGGIARLGGLRWLERAAGRRPVRARLGRQGVPRLPLRLIDHHEAHALSALLGPRSDGALVITCDAYGDGLSATVRRSGRPLETTVRLPAPGGPALLYGAVTVALGFREGDEGKLTGLAARGDPGRLAGRFRALFRQQGVAPRLRRGLGRRQLEELIEGTPREDVAAALQGVTEELLARWVGSLLAGEGGSAPLRVAGGLFANVALNRRLARLPGVDGFYVFPHMGDGGLAAGAAHALWYRLTGRLCEPATDMALGPAFDRGAALAAARAGGLTVRENDTPAAAIAAHLREGRVVCRFAGRDEFGPRALGNRSILFSARDPALGVRVNRALGRDDFMPFGPVIAAADGAACLRAPVAGVDLGHMTVALEATADFRRECPGAVHVDGTARVQAVDRESAPELHAVLGAFRRAGGERALINTSFNLHGEPIVHRPSDAVRTFVASGLDVLYLGDLECRASRPSSWSSRRSRCWSGKRT
jgi:carbamoyltransferase